MDRTIPETRVVQRMGSLAFFVSLGLLAYGQGFRSFLGAPSLLTYATAWFFRYPLLFLVLAIVLLSVYDLFGRGLGFWRLFLHESVAGRFGAGAAAAFLVAIVMTATYLMEPAFRPGGSDEPYRTVRDVFESSTPIDWVIAHAGGFHLGDVNDPNRAEDAGYRVLTLIFATGLPLWTILALGSVTTYLLGPSSYREARPLRLGRIGGALAFSIPWWFGIAGGVWLAYAAVAIAIQNGPRFSAWFDALRLRRPPLVHTIGNLFVPVFFLTFIVSAGVLLLTKSGSANRSMKLLRLIAGIAILGAFLIGAAWPPFADLIDPGPGSEANRQHLMVVVASIIAAAVAVAVLLRRSSVTADGKLNLTSTAPGVEVCVLLAGVVLADLYFHEVIGAIHGRIGQAVALLVLFTLVVVCNGDPYKLTLPDLDYRAPSRLDLTTINRQPVSPPAGAAFRDDREVLINWRRTLWRSENHEGEPPDDFKPKLAIVSVSGGALRAGYWSAIVLQRLRERLAADRQVDFDRRVRLITGASGGMVGTGAYICRIHEARQSGNPVPATWTRDLKIDALGPVAQCTAIIDVPSILVPFPPFTDRGRTLQAQWRTLIPNTFGSIRTLESNGEIPSIVFSPMLAEDGRRLLISNLDLEFLTLNQGPRAGAVNAPLSLNAIELRQAFPDSAPNFLLRTAVRLNASFPYVSPAVSLPTNPPRSPVDAGYYDNYGVNIACDWMDHHHQWLIANTSGVALIQVRDSDGTSALLQFEAETGSVVEQIRRSAGFLTTPFTGALAARYATNAFRNDEFVAAMGRLFTAATGNDRFLITAFFEFPDEGEVALNWQINADEFDALDEGLNRGRNPAQFQALVDWF